MTERLRQLADRLDEGLDAYEANQGPLPGFTPARRASLVGQFIDSSRVNFYIEHLRMASLSPLAAEPSDAWFHPWKAAIIRHREGDDDEAFWLIFLGTHFGRNRQAGWRYVREVYGALGLGHPWTWQRVTSDVNGFRDWLDAYLAQLSDTQVPHGFGNHRKYESLSGWTVAGTGSVVASYIAWIGEPPSHYFRFNEIVNGVGNDPQGAFDALYRSMAAVHRFGRLARFDYLSMIGKIGLLNLRPGKAYLRGSTGPLKGASALFGPGLTSTALEEKAIILGEHLGITFDVLEDALCNWQKSLDTFKRFRG